MAVFLCFWIAIPVQKILKSAARAVYESRYPPVTLLNRWAPYNQAKRQNTKPGQGQLPGDRLSVSGIKAYHAPRSAIYLAQRFRKNNENEKQRCLIRFFSSSLQAISGLVPEFP